MEVGSGARAAGRPEEAAEEAAGRPDGKAAADVHVLLVGLGSANRAFARLLAEKGGDLPVRLAIVGVLTGKSGHLVADVGCDVALPALLAAEKVERLDGAKPGGLSPEETVALFGRLRSEGRLDVVVEAIPTDHATGEPALSFAKAALSRGVSVVTANKAPVARALDELLALAQLHGCRYLYEAACMDGVPLFNMARHCLPHARILGFEGILNSTTNVILECLEKNATMSFEDALRVAQEMGIAETDATGDVDGWDAAVKCVCLARAWGLKPDASLKEVRPIQGIRGVSGADVQETLPSRRKLICRGRRLDDGVFRLSVTLEVVPPTSPFYHVCGASSCLTVFTDVLGPLTIGQWNPTIRDTGYGLFVDLCEACVGPGALPGGAGDPRARLGAAQ